MGYVLKPGTEVTLGGQEYTIERIEENGRFTNHIDGEDRLSVILYTTREIPKQEGI